ncbi:SOM1 [Fusarium acutatum]|uniref:SOM1 n=1 Tax=Fusarium acutatum TaxID=78861 RepID=A0A8H4NTA2_9HYPO|nr:SOM1 [Fusarium acutatum]
MDYHALLHTQIYDYFLSSGMYSCGQALLNSDYNLRHQVMHAAAQRCTTEPRNATPSLLDSGFGSSYSSPCEEPYLTDPEDPLRVETEPALLYQWFCTFWDALNSTQAQATCIPVQDCLSYPPNLPKHTLESGPTICQDFISLHPLGTNQPTEQYSVDSFEEKTSK